jgi:hypothetical protein
MTRIIVTGDRNWKNRWIVYDVLYKLACKHSSRDTSTLIITQGAASGADDMAGWSAYDLSGVLNVFNDPHPAEWYRLDPKSRRTFFFKGAGPQRNDKMLNLTNPPASLVISFHNNLAESKGTKHCTLGAIKRQIPVMLVAENGSAGAYSTSLIEPQHGPPELILLQGIQRLHPLTW